MDPAIIPPEMQTLLWSLAFDVSIVALVIVALLTTAKHCVKLCAHEGTLDNRWVQLALEVAPLVLGALIALVPGLFDGFPPSLQVLFGLLSGFASPGIYGYLKKRLPGLMLPKVKRNG